MKLSIITINRNNADGLRKTIESVTYQTFTNFEFVVIDGASTDGSVDVIKEYADSIAYWVSEPDKGIYNAMNKGILKSHGEYLLFMNSGDWLANERVIEDFYRSDFKEDIVIGNIYFDEEPQRKLYTSIKKEDFGFNNIFLGGCLSHQASFIKYELFQRFGLYNEQYKIASDFDFFIRTLILHNCSYNKFDHVVAFYDTTGISSNKQYAKLHQTEREDIFNALIPRIYWPYKSLYEENIQLRKLQDEYMHIKNGKFSTVIKLILAIKSFKHKIRKHK